MPVLVGVIAPYRKLLTNLLTERGSLPVYGWLPDDVAHLPVYVVGRPSLREALAKGVMTMTSDVSLLGRRISDEDSQRELDVLADELFSLLGGTRNVRVDDTHLRLVSMLPATVPVAGMEYPAYIASVSIETVTC